MLLSEKKASLNRLVSIPDLLSHTAGLYAQHTAFKNKALSKTYIELENDVDRAVHALRNIKACGPFSRIVLWGNKSYDYVVTMLAAIGSGAILVPVNPALAGTQVSHILRDAAADILICDFALYEKLKPDDIASVKHVFLFDEVLTANDRQEREDRPGRWHPSAASAEEGAAIRRALRRTDNDPCCILYTSGSTGRAKGVVLSHRNLVSGALSVADYFKLCSDDVILGILPLSFDAGLSQLTTAIASGATFVAHNYLIPQEVPALCRRFSVTVITAVPPLWMQLLRASWTTESVAKISRIANTGGRLPLEILKNLRAVFHHAEPLLMYGLTESFRSTYLDPKEIEKRPESIGKAIPNAEVMVLRPDGSACEPDEAGELVHRGPTVALGYWNDPELTAKRFRRFHTPLIGNISEERVVWSGDLVKTDSDGFLYFVSRMDETIKTMGYRVSPTEVEEIIYASGMVAEAAAIGIEDVERGQTILAFVVPAETTFDNLALTNYCRNNLPFFMVPTKYYVVESLPRNPNGKIDRSKLKDSLIA